MSEVKKPATYAEQITQLKKHGCERDNVVNLLDRCCSALFKALLTQRVCLHIAVTNSFPRSAVLLVDIKCSCESVVLLCNQPLEKFIHTP